MARNETLPAELHRAYLEITSRGPNRLTTSSFLAGLTFGAFAALTTVEPLPSGSPDKWATKDQAEFAIAFLLAAASMLFLAVAFLTYRALQNIAGLSPATAQEITSESNLSNVAQRNKLHRALGLYRSVSAYTELGIILLAISLVLIAYRLNQALGCGAMIILAVVIVVTAARWSRHR